jgi:hypothetical protein
LRQRGWSPSTLLHRIRVPFDVVPRAPSGEQNAPGWTPALVAAVVGLLVRGFVVAGRAVVGFVVGGAVVAAGRRRGLVLTGFGDREGAAVADALEPGPVDGGTTTGRVVAAAIASAGVSVAVAAALEVAGSSMNAPIAVNPPQHSTTIAAVIQPNSFQLVFASGAGP